MRIGETLARILSPAGADDEGKDARAADDADAREFRATFEAALARRREPAGAGGLDAVAGIVIDPRLVLSLGAPERLAPGGDRFDFERTPKPEPDAAAGARAAQPERAAERSAPAAGGAAHREEPAREATKPDARDEARNSSKDDALATGAAESDNTAVDVDAASAADEPGSAPAARARAGAITVESVARHIAASADRSASEIEEGAIGSSGVRAASPHADSTSGESKGPSLTAGAATTPGIAPSSAAGDAGGFDARANSDGAANTPRDLAAQNAGTFAPRAGEAHPFAATLAHELAAAGASPRAAAIAPPGASPAGDPARAARAETNEILARLSEGVASALRDGKREVVVRLTPPNLGAVRIRFQIDEQRLAARVEVSDPVVHRALESHLTELRTVLRQHAIDLADLSLAAGDGRARDGAGRHAHDEGSRDDTPRADTAPAPTALSPRRRAADRASGLDITA